MNISLRSGTPRPLESGGRVCPTSTAPCSVTRVSRSERSRVLRRANPQPQRLEYPSSSAPARPPAHALSRSSAERPPRAAPWPCLVAPPTSEEVGRRPVEFECSRRERAALHRRPDRLEPRRHGRVRSCADLEPRRHERAKSAASSQRTMRARGWGRWREEDKVGWEKRKKKKIRTPGGTIDYS